MYSNQKWAQLWAFALAYVTVLCTGQQHRTSFAAGTSKEHFFGCLEMKTYMEAFLCRVDEEEE